jgi:hypothetical protein
LIEKFTGYQTEVGLKGRDMIAQGKASERSELAAALGSWQKQD